MSKNIKKLLDYLYLIFIRYISVFPKYLVTKKMAKKYLEKPAKFSKSYLTKFSNASYDIDLLTIGFNNWQVIRLQHQNLKKNLRDKFRYVVVDNSTDEQSARSIKDYCDSHDILYLRLKNNPANGRNPSFSHGISINWAYRNILIYSQSRYLGIIDHDIFPYRPTTITKWLRSQPFYGHYQSRGSRWYLWPGFSFFSYDFIRTLNPNFEPIWGLDSGGGNWPIIYRKFLRGQIKWPKHKYIKYQDGETVQSSSVELLDDWLHLMAASGWMNNHKSKDVDKIMKLISDKKDLK